MTHSRTAAQLQHPLYCLGLLAILLVPLPVEAAEEVEVRQLEVDRDGNRYSVALEVRLAASPATAFATMVHYEDLPRINPAVQSVEIRARDVHHVLMHTTTRFCVAGLCRTFKQLQDIHEQGDASPPTLTAEVQPDNSNLALGHAQWRFHACEQATCLHFEARIEPDFWVPPLIGPWLIRRALQREALVTAEGIQRLAREREVP